MTCHFPLPLLYRLFRSESAPLLPVWLDSSSFYFNAQIRTHPLWNFTVIPASCALPSALPSWAHAPVSTWSFSCVLSGLTAIHTACFCSQSLFTFIVLFNSKSRSKQVLSSFFRGWWGLKEVISQGHKPMCAEWGLNLSLWPPDPVLS